MSRVPERLQFHSEFEAPGESPGFLLWQVTNAWQRAQREALSPLGLTHVQLVLLASAVWLHRDGASVNQVSLARHARTDPMMTSQVLRALERRGWISRSADPDDGRAALIQPTRKSIALVKRAVPVVETVDRRFFDGLGRSAKSFTTLLRRLATTG